MTVKSPHPYWVRRCGRTLLHQLAYAASKGNGVFARRITVAGGNDRANAARYLRECGLPIYARRAGEDTVWFLLRDTDPTALLEEWKHRILHDAYAEVCRAHMALSPHPWATTEANDLRIIALNIGAWIGEDPADVLDDIQPAAMPEPLTAIIASLDSGTIEEEE